jgi:pyruvate/2-oxoglutarate dehydrogenase complex dihydrolipoamide dehydrogenase (E3) component
MPYPKHKLMAIASSPAGQRAARDRIGERAADIIHVGQAVMICEGTIEYFVNTVFTCPTLAEAYKIAAFEGLDKL